MRGTYCVEDGDGNELGLFLYFHDAVAAAKRHGGFRVWECSPGERYLVWTRENGNG